MVRRISNFVQTTTKQCKGDKERIRKGRRSFWLDKQKKNRSIEDKDNQAEQNGVMKAKLQIIASTMLVVIIQFLEIQ